MKFLTLALTFICLFGTCTAKKIDVLLITGHTDKHHNWEIMSETIKDVLSEYKPFRVDVVETPKSGDLSANFSDYDVVIFNINDVEWGEQTKRRFEDYMKSGGGMVVIHEANNAFPEWEEYNRMIGLGGWGGRTKDAGDYLYWRGGEFITDGSDGRTGSHGRRVPFNINIRNSEHPITKGLPERWTHNDDELYSNLRGHVAENIEVLATGFSDKKSGGSDKEEPVLLTISYGKGRVFHTVLGHTTKDFTKAVRTNRGFQITLSRGVEWAATGRVKQRSDVSLLVVQ